MPTMTVERACSPARDLKRKSVLRAWAVENKVRWWAADTSVPTVKASAILTSSRFRALRVMRALRRRRSHGRERPVRLGGQVEIALRQSLDLVGPDFDLALPPGHVEIRMVSLPLRDRADLVGELERLGEILELKGPL